MRLQSTSWTAMALQKQSETLWPLNSLALIYLCCCSPTQSGNQTCHALSAQLQWLWAPCQRKWTQLWTLIWVFSWHTFFRVQQLKSLFEYSQRRLLTPCPRDRSRRCRHCWVLQSQSLHLNLWLSVLRTLQELEPHRNISSLGSWTARVCCQ